MSKIKTLLVDYICENKAMKADHVSKSELRAWCEEQREARRKYGHKYFDVGFVEACSLILKRFCKGEQ